MPTREKSSQQRAARLWVRLVYCGRLDAAEEGKGEGGEEQEQEQEAPQALIC